MGVGMRVFASLFVRDDVPEIVPLRLSMRELEECWEFVKRGINPYPLGACASPFYLLPLARCNGVFLATFGDLIVRDSLGKAGDIYWLNPITAYACACGSLESLLFALALQSPLFTLDFSDEGGLGNWYLPMVVFPRFEKYFRRVWCMHSWIYYIPITLRLNEPHLLLAISNIFKPNPTLNGAALNAALAVLHFDGEECGVKRTTVILVGMIAGLPLVVRRVALFLWLGPGTANANHVYFQDFIFTFAHAILVSFACRAAVAKRRRQRDSGFA